MENKPIAQKIESLIEEIFKTKDESTEADTTDIERQIDMMVYELYGLNKNEISLIENKE